MAASFKEMERTKTRSAQSLKTHSTLNSVSFGHDGPFCNHLFQFNIILQLNAVLATAYFFLNAELTSCYIFFSEAMPETKKPEVKREEYRKYLGKSDLFYSN